MQASEDELEFGVGKQGPEVRVRGTEKAIPYIGLANLANVNTAVVPEESAFAHAELPLHLARAVPGA